MRPFKTIDALVIPVDRANVDTDAIVAKQFMKSISRTGYGENLFDQWRYLDKGEPGMDNSKRPKNTSFALNDPRYAGAQILLARENFGCGSSREHAVWALWDYGIRSLIAPSFADIFYANCFKNGILPIRLDPLQVDALFQQASGAQALRLSIDLATQSIEGAAGGPIRFDLDAQRKHRLSLGLDDIAMTLQKSERIHAYEAKRRALEPWLFS